MALFKSKEERQKEKLEQHQKALKEFLETRNLENLSEKDIEFIDLLREEIENATLYSIKGSEGELKQVELMLIMIEQNWLIIKLLSEISQRLDK